MLYAVGDIHGEYEELEELLEALPLEEGDRLRVGLVSAVETPQTCWPRFIEIGPPRVYNA